MEIKIDNKSYQIKFGKEEEVRKLFAPYGQRQEIKELYEFDPLRIAIDGLMFDIGKKIFMEKVYPYLRELTKETLDSFGTTRWV
jgi:hypothetical protein